MREPVRDASRSALLAVLLVPFLLAGSLSVQAADASVPLVDPRLGPLVQRTVERAVVRFETSTCSMLLTDFSDLRTGEPLASTLAASGRTASGFLGSLRFVDADHMVQCRRRPAYAWVPVGGDVVFVCTSRFTALVKKNEWLAGNILVHETLHSLGLGENPPSSEAITEMVGRRCGR